MSGRREVYLDNAATTKPYREVTDAMTNCLQNVWGNPSSLYQIGDGARNAVLTARQKIATTLGCMPSEIRFTSGGTESDNWVIKGVADGYIAHGKHIITTAIEHKAVLQSCHWLEKRGYEIDYVEPDERGYINPADVEKLIRDDTILVSVMFANNEIGTIQPIKEIGEICRKHGVLFHTDAVQAYGHIKIDVNDMNIDFLSASGHKFHGPKGVGFLYVRDGVRLMPYIHGGGQESGTRAGTENVPGIVGMGVAAEMADMLLTLHHTDHYVMGLRDYFIEKTIAEIQKVHFNGSIITRLPNNVNFTFYGVAA